MFNRRSGGGCEISDDGTRQQIRDHERHDASVDSFLSSCDSGTPVAVILGDKNIHCPSTLPHRYNVLDWFIITHVWPEPNGTKLAFRARLQKVDLGTKSWWAIKGSAAPVEERDFSACALSQTCTGCHRASSQVYRIGWVCLWEDCSRFFKIRGQTITNLTYNKRFLDERRQVLRQPPTKLLPTVPKDESGFANQWWMRQGWTGVVCPKCGRCNAAMEWQYWKCEADDCDWTYELKHPITSHCELQPFNGLGYSGHAPSHNICKYPFTQLKMNIYGPFVINTYEILPGNYVWHFQANNTINEDFGSAHDTLRLLQEGTGIPLQRMSVMTGSPGKLWPSDAKNQTDMRPITDGSLTRHFAVNYVSNSLEPIEVIADYRLGRGLQIHC